MRDACPWGMKIAVRWRAETPGSHVMSFDDFKRELRHRAAVQEVREHVAAQNAEEKRREDRWAAEERASRVEKAVRDAGTRGAAEGAGGSAARGCGGCVASSFGCLAIPVAMLMVTALGVLLVHLLGFPILSDLKRAKIFPWDWEPPRCDGLAAQISEAAHQDPNLLNYGGANRQGNVCHQPIPSTTKDYSTACARLKSCRQTRARYGYSD